MEIDTSFNESLLDLQSDGPTPIVIEAFSGEAVTLPAGVILTTADFSRSGPDLVLTTEDGGEIVVQNFFGVGQTPAIISESGAQISGDLATQLAGPMAPAQFAQAQPTGATEAIGQVESIAGTVTATRSDGSQQTLNVGDPIFQGDVLQTGTDGSIGVVLADETTFAMAENGRMVMDEMVYDPETKEGNIAISIVFGVFVFISGEIAKAGPDAMAITTPVATLGIRGTQGGVTYREGEALEVVLMSEANGSVGEMIISNAAGVTVLNLANQASVVASATTPPSPPQIMTDAAIATAYSVVLSAMPPGTNNFNDYGASGENLESGIETAAGGPVPDLFQLLLFDYQSVDGSLFTLPPIDYTLPTIIPPQPPEEVDPEEFVLPPPPEPIIIAKTGQIIDSQPVTVIGSSGNDSIDVSYSATDVVGSSYAFAVVGGFFSEASGTPNIVNISAGNGTNDIDVTFSALAESSEAGTFSYASASIRQNQVNIDGGTGIDTIDVNMTAFATGSGIVNDAISDNKIDIDGGEGDNIITVSLDAGRIANNEIFIDTGGGGDLIDVSLDSDTENIFNNDITVDAGGGDDVIIVSMTGGSVTYNDIIIDAGGGNDTISLTLDGTEDAFGNNVILNGGAGSDTFNLFGESDSITNLTLIYDSLGDLGDTITGFDAVSGLFIKVDNSEFDLDSSPSVTTITFSGDGDYSDTGGYWDYHQDTIDNNYKLFYDAGGNSGGSEVVVVDFGATDVLGTDNVTIATFEA